MTESKDPIKFEDGAWYFYDECWVDRYGPFDSEEEARDELTKYCLASEILTAYPTDDEGIREWWRKRGGSFHGPRIETATMREDLLLNLLRCQFEHINSLQRIALKEQR